MSITAAVLVATEMTHDCKSQVIDLQVPKLPEYNKKRSKQLPFARTSSVCAQDALALLTCCPLARSPDTSPYSKLSFRYGMKLD